jgi:hypothetical protein
MNPLAVASLVLGGINCCAGAFYLLLYLRRRDIKEHLPFASMCLCVAVYDVLCAGLYDSSSVAEGVFWQRQQLRVLLVTGVSMIWFVGLITEGRVNRVLRALIAVLSALLLVSLATSRAGISVSASTPAIKPVYWGQRLLVTYYESVPGLIDVVSIPVSYVAYAYLFYLLFRAYRREPSQHLAAVMVGQVAYWGGLINDGLVASRAYSFLYVSEYAFLLVIMTMAYALLSRLVDLQAAVEGLNSALERRVEEALADIKVLRGLIPICAWCKKIRDDQGYWSQIEVYVAEHSQATFTHGLCPDCAVKLRPSPEAVSRAEAPRSP